MIDQHEMTRLRGEYHHEYDKSMKSFMQYICHVLESLIQLIHTSKSVGHHCIVLLASFCMYNAMQQQESLFCI